MARGFGGRSGFPGGGANMNALLKQAQKMQADMAKAQEEIANTVIESSVGGGMVSLKMDGSHRVTDLVIKPEAVDPDDIEMLQDLIISAFNDANDQLEKLTENKMGRFGQMGAGLGF